MAFQRLILADSPHRVAVADAVAAPYHGDEDRCSAGVDFRDRRPWRVRAATAYLLRVRAAVRGTHTSTAPKMSVLEFTSVFATALVVWTSATYVPATTRWNAFDRVFLPMVAACGAWIGTGVLAVWYYDTFRNIDVANPDWRQRHVLSVIVCVALMGVFVFPPRLLNYCETHSCFLFTAASTPCGASSCSSLTAASAYNPNGWFGSQQLAFTEGRATVCVYRGCAWGANNNGTIKGYPSQDTVGGEGFPNTSASACDNCGLATNRPQDYTNPALGCVGPLLLGLNTSVVPTFCPGIRVVAGTGDTQALSVCGYCGPYLQKHKGVPLPPHCPSSFATDQWQNAGIRTHPVLAEDDWIVCDLLCPGPREISSPDATAEQLSAAIIATLVMVGEVLIQELVLPLKT